jgi:hypothetical protein
MLSFLEFGIAVAMAIAGIRGFWKLQHQLDRRGYVLQTALFLLGLAMTLAGFYMPIGLLRSVVFDYGVLSMAIFLLVPEIVYQLLLFYDQHRRANHRRRAWP